MIRTKHLVLLLVFLSVVLAGTVMYLLLFGSQHDNGLNRTLSATGGSNPGVAQNKVATDTTEAARQAMIAKLKQEAPQDTQTGVTPQQDTKIDTPDGGIPLGDGKRALSPKVGYVYSCLTNFDRPVSENEPWIENGYWFPDKKPHVSGSVTWNNQVSITTPEGARLISSNGLPDHPTGIFPIRPADPAYQYDKNPNTITAQTNDLQLPLNPRVASAPSCLPMGMIGVALNGVAIYNALDAAGVDAAAHEVQDGCAAHPQGAGEYHYHGPSPCMPDEKTSGLIGYALDGFGIYGMRDASTGAILHNSDLDVCHGTTSPVMWNGTMVTIYHYVLTDEYPYTLGCFRGTPVAVRRPASAQPQGTAGQLPPPPQQ
jgi:hypothetical protein